MTGKAIYVEGKMLPFHILEKLNAKPGHYLKIVNYPDETEYDDVGNPLPPEESFKDELVEEIEQRCKAHQEGKNKGTICKTTEEVNKFFDNIVSGIDDA